MREPYNRNTYFLIRHGEAENTVLNIVSSEHGKKQYPLTERGRKQVAETAEFLISYKPDFIVASPVLRTFETAEILRDVLHLPLSTDKRLTEAQMGVFEDKKRQSFLDFMRENGGRVDGMPELGIEGYMDIRERVQGFLRDVVKHFSGKKIILVSHGDSLQEIYGELVGIPVGPTQMTGHGWYPEKGSCLVITAGKIQEFVPKV